MHEHHDEDLILELLETSVTETEAASRLDRCEQCIADLTEQRSIAAHLTELDPVALTASERADLRSAVFSELDTGGTVVPIRPSRGFDWMRVGTVAAALVGVVAVAGLFSVIGESGSDGGEAFDQAATAVAESDTGDIATAEAPLADEERSTESLGMDDSAADAAATAPPSDLVIDLGAVDVPTFTSELERLGNRVEDMTESSGVLQSDADRVPIACLGEISDPGSIWAIVTALVDGFEVEVYIDDAGEQYGYASIDCSVYELP